MFRSLVLAAAGLAAGVSPALGQSPDVEGANGLRGSFAIGGLLEIAAIDVNAHRKPGGNETSFGDFAGILTVRADLTPAAPRRFTGAGLEIAWIPGSGALDYADPREHNRHNQNWLRADGTFSAPELTANVWARWRLGERQALQLRLGGFLASGLEALAGAPSVHYLTTPAPLLHAQHWDKGLQMRWELAESVTLKAALIDGDWAVGEPSLMRLHNSAANSYPSYAAGAAVHIVSFERSRPGVARDGITAGWEATRGDLGSTWPPGSLYEKRRQDNSTFYVAVRGRVGGGVLEGRAFHVRLERNPLGTGAGSHDPAVVTTGDGAELVWRGARVAAACLDLYAHAWRMRNRDGTADGEIWPGEFGLRARAISGWLIGARWNDPLAAHRGVRSYAGLAYGWIRPDVPDAFGSSRNLRALFRLVLGVQR